MKRLVEIAVFDVVKDADGKTVVVASDNNRANVREGDCFVFCYEIDRNEALNGVLEPKKFNVKTVCLNVDKIDLGRGRFVSEVPIGHTAGLYMSGDGIDLVQKGKLLRTAG